MDNLNASASLKTTSLLGWYKWYSRDFWASMTVRSMSPIARSIYRDLLDIQWEHGQLLPKPRLLRALGWSESEWQEFEPYLQECFPNGINPKMDEIRQQAIEDRERQAEKGRKSAEARARIKEFGNEPTTIQTRWVNHAPQTVLLGSNSNDLPTSVQPRFNHGSTDVQRVFNQTETETETQTETETYKRFIRPSQSEVEEYLVERRWKNPERKAEQFISHYESKGWKIGKAKMKSWRSAVITWEGRMTDDDFVPKPKPKEPIEGIDYQILPSGLEVTLDGRLWCIETWRKENGL
jgi:hypothetical protein